MYFENDNNRGYTRGGLDVTEAINLFFKFLLLSPVFLLASIVTASMLKHVIYQGVPTMSKPTESQQEQLREQNSNIGIGRESGNNVREVVEPQVTESVTPVTPPAVKPVFSTRSVETKAERDERVMRKFCVETWLPKYGNNPNAIAAGGPCFKYQ